MLECESTGNGTLEDFQHSTTPVLHYSKMSMTEREKRIITLLSKYGALSKKELVEREEMSWATAVKIVSRLEKAGILRCAGTDDQPETTGKNPLLYDLSERTPLAIGIDVSYSTTNIILTNLRKDILEKHSCQTPKDPTVAQLRKFLVDTCLQFVKNTLTDQDHLEGVGIGIPLWLVQEENIIFPTFHKTLETQLHTKIQIENNVRSYTMYKKWAGKAFSLDDFIVITIRSGVGAGIFSRGELVRGTHGMAGELSHITVIEDGKPCRCGQQGCLETLINQDVLYQEYLRKVRKEPIDTAASVSGTELRQGLAALFSLAKQGHQEASAVVEQAAYHLGKGIAVLLKILDIPNIIIVADFGPDGDALIPYLKKEVRRRLLSGIEFSVTYYPLEQLGFAQGAALLILKDYLTTL